MNDVLVVHVRHLFRHKVFSAAAQRAFYGKISRFDRKLEHKQIRRGSIMDFGRCSRNATEGQGSVCQKPPAGEQPQFSRGFGEMNSRYAYMRGLSQKKPRMQRSTNMSTSCRVRSLHSSGWRGADQPLLRPGPHRQHVLGLRFLLSPHLKNSPPHQKRMPRSEDTRRTWVVLPLASPRTRLPTIKYNTNLLF